MSSPGLRPQLASAPPGAHAAQGRRKRPGIDAPAMSDAARHAARARARRVRRRAAMPCAGAREAAQPQPAALLGASAQRAQHAPGGGREAARRSKKSEQSSARTPPSVPSSWRVHDPSAPCSRHGWGCALAQPRAPSTALPADQPHGVAAMSPGRQHSATATPLHPRHTVAFTRQQALGERLAGAAQAWVRAPGAVASPRQRAERFQVVVRRAHEQHVEAPFLPRQQLPGAPPVAQHIARHGSAVSARPNRALAQRALLLHPRPRTRCRSRRPCRARSPSLQHRRPGRSRDPPCAATARVHETIPLKAKAEPPGVRQR